MRYFSGIVLIIILLFSCSEPFSDENPFAMDLRPPELNGISLSESRTLIISFDESVSFSENAYFSEPDLPLESWTAEGNNLTIVFAEDQIPGKMYKCRGDVEDEKGNRLSFLIRFYGWNPNVPVLLINEFNPEGSGNNPDTVELYALESGNTAGMGLFTGTSEFFNSYYVLPDLEVAAGDFIIVHLRPEGLPEEISETTDKAVSGGKLASDSAWDIWVNGDMPLSGSNGLISLYTNPFGSIVDAVPYSNRVSADSEDYRGWTAATYEMIEELSFLGVWNDTEGFIRPEDAVYSEGTTGTRSICRDSSFTDTDKRSDWHIVPTGEKSFGDVNSDNVYTP